MSWSAQTSNWTANNRYPGIFRTVQAHIAQSRGVGLGEARLKILSFGCSDGSELSSLRSYFPEALLYGCDVSLPALRSASESLMADEAVLFESSAASVQHHGPFDVIFAMSVLCRFPESSNPARLDRLDEYAFADFETAAHTLADNLKDGGLLCLYNTNYSFAELPLAADFRPVRSCLLSSNGFVDKFSANGHRVTWCERDGPFYVHRLRKDGDVAQIDFTDCIFEKARGPERCNVVPIATQSLGDGAGPPQFYRFGPDLARCAQQGLVATALGYWFEDDDGGRVVRAWHRTTPTGAIKTGGTWSVQGDAASRASLSAPRAAWPVAPMHEPPASLATRTAKTLAHRIRASLRLGSP